jgi:hypothetical protein
LRFKVEDLLKASAEELLEIGGVVRWRVGGDAVVDVDGGVDLGVYRERVGNSAI